ncbi:hypothetical protein HDG41_007928 [Paraburkholderia sp. JPY162]|uniref:Uncharacterized protein n=1 Tax=Paraburkholderia youngii TaxID=2782701 RepID=A0A7W8LF33_9BURK|nr:hypothetical protein [Paraburkholderia youngii]
MIFLDAMQSADDVAPQRRNEPNLYPRYLRSRTRRGLRVGFGTGNRAWQNLQNTRMQGSAGCVHGISADRHYEETPYAQTRSAIPQ